jgi:opacity protein-like surface antigen
MPTIAARIALSSVLSSTLLLAAGSAFAADIPRRNALPAQPIFVQAQGGFYFGNRNSVSMADDTRFNLGGGAARITTQYEPGFSNGFMIGYNFGPTFGFASPRLELEVGRSQFSVDTHTVNGGVIPAIDSFGETKAITGFASAFLDFNLSSGNDWLSRVKPFIGAGIGFANVELRKQGISATGVIMKDSDTGMAFHVSAGVGFEVFERTTLEIGYRYMQSSDLSFTARDGTKTKTDLKANMITFGLRRQF